MERFKINNLWVYFPFVPYAPQETFMKKMIESMDNAQNALLESPTGTGKTLCLVCASLAWLDHQKKLAALPEPEEDDDNDEKSIPSPKKKGDERSGQDKTAAAGDHATASADSDRGSRDFKIYFCTRTHSQLIQAVNEFRNTSYGHLRSTALGSRKHLCLNPVALKASSLDDKCTALRKEKRKVPCSADGPDIEDLPQKCTSCLDDHRCQYYVNYEDMISSGGDHVFTQAPAMDQRTLIEKSREHKVCPFYMSRHLQKKADIIFLPYSYIFNPHILKGLQLNVMDSIIIIDEGHNLERVCEENASFEMKISDITNCRQEVVKCINEFVYDKDFPHDVGLKDMQELEKILDKFEELANLRILPGRQNPHYDGKFCLKLFEESGFTQAHHPRLLYNLKQLSKFLGTKEQKNDGTRKIHGVIDTVYAIDKKDFQDFVLFKEESTNEKFQENKDFEPKIFFWCFNAGIIMKSLKAKGVRSFIVTSGTLAPLEPLKQSLTIPFEVDLLNEHVVDTSQVLSLCIPEAPTCSGDKIELLDASYSNREKNGEGFYDALGNVIREVAKATPKGLLIFFPSSKVKIDCLIRWNDIFNKDNISLFHEIYKLKEIFEEPKESSELHALQEKYTKKIKNSSGACLIGVTSGKVSEGIDFKDDLGRAVIMVGLPYPPMYDPWVQYKRSHLSRNKGSLGEQSWYLSQAIRPVNQALGRIIRHQKDFGCVLLPDDRYNTPRVRRALPRWLEQGLQTVTFSEIGSILRNFFSKIHLRIREIEKKTEDEQAQIRKRHMEELKKEELSSEIYFSLCKKRDLQRLREESLKEETSSLLKILNAEKSEVEGLWKEIRDKSYALSLLEGSKDDTMDDSVKDENIKVKEENDSFNECEKKNGDGEPGVVGSDIKEEYDSDCESDGQSEWDEALLTPV